MFGSARLVIGPTYLSLYKNKLNKNKVDKNKIKIIKKRKEATTKDTQSPSWLS